MLLLSSAASSSSQINSTPNRRRVFGWSETKLARTRKKKQDNGTKFNEERRNSFTSGQKSSQVIVVDIGFNWNNRSNKRERSSFKEELEIERKRRRRRRKRMLPVPPNDSSSMMAGSWLSSSIKRPAAKGEAKRRSSSVTWKLLLPLMFLSILIEFTGASAISSQSQTTRITGTNQQVAEGLSLNGNNGNREENVNQWPLANQLERIKNESRVGALLGQNVILNCAVQFKDGLEKPFVVNWLKYPNKLPIYIWYAGYPAHIASGYESRVSRVGQASLNLSSIKETDQGLYECKIYYLDRRPEDKANGTWIFLDVQAPPHFSQTPAPVSYVQAGDSLKLTCQAESTPAPILRWYKNKVPIDSDEGAYRLTGTSSQAPSFSLETAQETTSGRIFAQLDLHIDNVQAGTTAGDYSCLASNTEGSVEAKSQVVLAIPAVITAAPRNQTRLEGEKLELTCQAKALPANITYKWFFNDKPIHALKWFDSRHSIRRDGSLVIHSLHRDDQGEYKCQATNGLSHKIPSSISSSSSKSTTRNSLSNGSSKSGILSKTETPVYAEASAYLTVEYPARVTYSPLVQYLPLGLSGIIRCFVQASPQVEFFTWTLNNQQFDPNIDSNVERLKNGSLLIRQVNKQYEGKYRCTPFNKHGSAGSSQAMDIRVEEPPYFELRPADFYKATLNGHVKIPCEARGLPKPNVHWRRVLTTISSGINPQVAVSPKATGFNKLTTSGQQQVSSAILLADEAADETPDDHHLYATTSEIPQAHFSQLNVMVADNERANNNNNNEDDDDEQQSVITYAKLPSDRSEFKSSHLLLHKLRKEDHGRYECVIENEVATLVASTMLYIEETTPHAPGSVRVDTKIWSARLTWTPGYDGGFEQSFVVWYRQVDRANAEESDTGSSSPVPSSQQAVAQLSSTEQHHELIDLNWKSVNVPQGNTTSFTVQNLSQDTSYEFYVRAKNIIGEGPRSQIVSATTKRAISGSLTPIANPSNGEQVAASTTPNQEGELLPNRQAPPLVDEEENEVVEPTANPTVVGIIHLVDMTTSRSAETGSNSGQSSASARTNPSQQQQQQPVIDSADESRQQNSSKVIRIFFPAKQVAGSLNSSELLNTGNNSNKRPRFNDSNNDSSTIHHLLTSSDSSAQVPLHRQDSATAPHNISMIKVAQGWVLQWWPPKRPVQEPTALERLEAAASSLDPIPVLSQTERLTGEPSAYSIEIREKGSAWQPLATSRERSLLLKDLKPGAEYTFRVFAHSAASGTRGAPSSEFKYLMPDNRRKPGSTQALSAGVVSGILFFIACIVIAVCAVNMCNKRRKKRAEKAAYVMMACPVLESHHDIAALNSNSLLKNSRASTAQGRVPSLDEKEGHLSGNLRFFAGDRLLKGANELANSSRRLTHWLFSGSEDQGGPRCRPEQASEESIMQQPEQTHKINFSSNAPLPVDVGPQEQAEMAAIVCVDQHQTPIDDYWIRKPSDRKWGTLTLAGSKLAERRAREFELRTGTSLTVAGEQKCEASNSCKLEVAPEVDSIAGEMVAHNSEGGRVRKSYFLTNGSLTLPRSFRASPIKIPLNNNCSTTETGHPNSIESPAPQVPPRPSYRPPVQHQIGGPTLPNRREQSQQMLHHRSKSHVEPVRFNRMMTSGMSCFGGGWRPQTGNAQFTGCQSEGLQFQPTTTGRLYSFLDTTDAVVVENGEQLDISQLINNRNSFARSTLPLVAPPSGYAAQSLIAPPFHHLHKLQPPPPPPSTAICPFYPPMNITSVSNRDDDPVMENACLGSYKRKSRLPHIEAQFTIEPPVRSLQQPDNNSRVNDHSMESNGSALFVRSLPNEQPPVGMPQAGQRSEQRRLRPPPALAQVETIGAREKIETYLRHYETASQLRPAMRNSNIEKPQVVVVVEPEQLVNNNNSPIELEQVEELTFQPYHNLPSLKYTITLPLRKSSDGKLLLNETSHLRRSKREPNRSLNDTSSNTTSSILADRHQQACKRKLDSKSKRLGSSSSCPAQPVEYDLEHEEMSLETSCADRSRISAHHLSRYSLESALSQPTVGHPNTSLGASQPVDSLEKSLDSIHPVQLQLQLQFNRSQMLETSKLPTIPTAIRSQPFYLTSPSSPSQLDDYSSIDENILEQHTDDNQRVEPPITPPPIPPHRTQQPIEKEARLLTKSQDGDSELSPERCTSPEPDFALAESINGDQDESRRLESNSSQVSTSSSTTSNSAATTTTTDGNGNGAVSESLHSVDENYEFDLVSSSGSSFNRKTKRKTALDEASVKNELVVQVNNDLYTQVNKQQLRKVSTANNNNNKFANSDGEAVQDRQVNVERSRYYDYSSRRKEIRLNGQDLSGYDIVYDPETAATTTEKTKSDN